MGRKSFVIKSLTFKRYYSNSKLNNIKNNNLNTNENNSNNNNENLESESEGINISNPLDKNKNMTIYIDMESDKKIILAENKGKPGIYMITNKLTKDFYIGQSKNLYNRFLNYFNRGYLNRSPNSIVGRAIIKYGYSNFSLTILEYCDKADLTAREQHYFDTLDPVYNILKIAGGYAVDFTHTEETKNHLSKSLKGVYSGEKAYWYGKKFSNETKALMSSTKTQEKNPFFGEKHSEEAKELMREKALGRKHSEETKLLMSSKRGSLVNIFERCDIEGFKLIGSFVSARRAGKFLGLSGSTVVRYMKSGEIFKDKYKFTSPPGY